MTTEILENSKTEVIVLPKEVEELAIRISSEKQKEVKDVLNEVFRGTANWEMQIESIVVKDINDTMSIQLADVARKNIKTARLAAEKMFDAKRDIVQAEMADYKLEDQLWLKAKQITQLTFKALEEKAEYKAKFIERYESQQKELRTQDRIIKVSKFNTEINRIEFENMTEEMFAIFLQGIEKSYNDKIEAENKLKAEQIAKQKAFEEEQKRIKVENEKLKAEAIKKEKLIEAERKQKEKLLAEIKAKEDKEKEIKLKAEAETKAKKIAEKKANAAPDKVKLLELANYIENITLPILKSDEAAIIKAKVMVKLKEVVSLIKKEVDEL